jgi:1-acyl-sn-glycerol-3-phosphate acyltransferase
MTTTPAQAREPAPVVDAPSPPAARGGRRRAEADVPVPRLATWLAVLLRPIHTVFMPFFFRINMRGRHHIPVNGPVLLTPVHRSRWDPILLACLTRRGLQFLASHDEFVGLQGWMMRMFGTVPVNTKRPSPGTLKACAELLRRGRNALVIFPEGSIYYYPPDQVHPLRPGTAWIALKVQREIPDQPVRIVPVRIRYSQLKPKFRSGAGAEAYPPIEVRDYLNRPEKEAIAALTAAIQAGMGDVVNTSTKEMITPRDQQPPRKRSYGR